MLIKFINITFQLPPTKILPTFIIKFIYLLLFYIFFSLNIFQLPLSIFHIIQLISMIELQHIHFTVLFTSLYELFLFLLISIIYLFFYLIFIFPIFILLFYFILFLYISYLFLSFYLFLFFLSFY
ncbi:hypothetical protein EDI_025280 [Entamoeba dispar SAW760]|uniref:Uncharacterized protein n=1 Tax=Entamoeba dispar (strain ATCC PRA-260 / SAW760) TaxID=370354 RepID=B0EBX0_ENTDS|nr:uncharacterized protein EDI_025280 [Entamoeba dispar SAW760]EDR27976.1 hypothetical protein EDI_025280 [Entamoeba dispar SAW760]|eukprot:EDR27976.1 hypothetical protein EDI_025280 [Entamoeba dispar SAW760]